MDRSGSFSFTCAANDPKAAAISEKRRVICMALLNDVWTEIGNGIIDRIETTPGADDSVMLIVSGQDIVYELSGFSAGYASIASGANAIDAQSGLNILQAIAANTYGAAWTFDYAGVTSAPDVYALLAGESLLAAVGNVAKAANYHFRAGPARTLEFFQAFAPSGVRAIRATGNLAPETCAITNLRRTVETHDLFTRIVPFGAGQGHARLTLAPSDRDTPAGYTVNKAAVPGFIQRDDAVAAYGRIDRWVEFKEIGPIANTDLDVRAAANALFDYAKIHLDLHSQRATHYALEVAQCSRALAPGQTIRIDYRDPSAGLMIAEDLFIIESTVRVGADGIFTTSLTVSDQDRWPLNDAEVLGNALSEAKVYRSHPQLNANSYTATYTENVDDTETATIHFWFGNEVVQLQQVLLQFELLRFESTVRSVGLTSQSGGSGQLETDPGGSGNSGSPSNDTSGTPSVADTGAAAGNTGASTGNTGAPSSDSTGGPSVDATGAASGNTGAAAGNTGTPSSDTSGGPSTNTSGSPSVADTGAALGSTGASSGNPGSSSGDTGAASGNTGASSGDTGAASGNTSGPSSDLSGAASGSTGASIGSTGSASGNTGTASGNTGTAGGSTGASSGNTGIPSTNNSGGPSIPDTGAATGNTGGSGTLNTNDPEGGDTTASGQHVHGVFVTNPQGGQPLQPVFFQPFGPAPSNGILVSETGPYGTAAVVPSGNHTHPIGSHTHSIDNHTHGLGSHTHSMGDHTHSLGSHTHSLAGHTHSLDSHTHTLGNHAHNLNDHTHSLGSHTHSLDGHTHTLGNHTHGLGNHTHGLGNHAHSLNSHSHSLNSHSHGLNSHTHSLGGHTHTLNSHTHTLGNHTHSLGNHTHSLAGHTHTLGNHAHTLGNHTHSLGNHNHSLNSHVHTLGGHTHSLNNHTHSLNNHTHTITPVVAMSYGIFRESIARTYAIADLEYRVNGGEFAPLAAAAFDLGNGRYRLDITSFVQNSTSFRPLQENNTLQIRRAATAPGDETVTVKADLSVRNIIQSINFI